MPLEIPKHFNKNTCSLSLPLQKCVTCAMCRFTPPSVIDLFFLKCFQTQKERERRKRGKAAAADFIQVRMIKDLFLYFLDAHCGTRLLSLNLRARRVNSRL